MSALMGEHQSTAAWRELLDTLGGLDRSFLDGDRAVTDDRHIADGYRMIATTLGVAFDTYLFVEPSRPMFVEVNTPFRRDRRWGGDNTDAYYGICPVEPQRRYRISGNRGDSVYFSLTNPRRGHGRTALWPSCATTSSTSMPQATSLLSWDRYLTWRYS
jgi:hypothetical protein